MKIFHPLLCYFPSQAGGPANTLYWLNKELVKINYKTSVLSTLYGLKSQVKFEYGQAHNVEFIDSKGKKFLRKGLEGVIDNDIIQFSSIFFPPTIPLLIAALFNKKKIIISPRGELYSSALMIKPFQKNVWLKLIKAFQHKIFFHATNEFEKLLIVQQFPRAAGIEVIPNFIEIPEKYNINVDINQLIFIGRINPIKNIDLIIKAIAIIRTKHNRNIKLLIAGDARLDYEIEYFQQLKIQVMELGIEENVTFLGHVGYKQKQKLLATSYTLILPSKSENFGNVVIEALAQGTPVIASKNTPWEILEATTTGHWITADPNKIVEAILDIYSIDSKDYNLMRTRARKLCLEKFDVSTNVHHWENFYKKIIA